MQNVMAVIFVIYVVLGFVIYHSVFDIWYFNLGKALIGEIIGACLFASLMTGLTLKFWPIGALIIGGLGISFSAKCDNPTFKKVIIAAFVIAAVMIAITGIKYNNQ